MNPTRASFNAKRLVDTWMRAETDFFLPWRQLHQPDKLKNVFSHGFSHGGRFSNARRSVEFACWLETNPAEKLQMPKEEHRLPSSYLTLEEAEALLGVVDLTSAAGLRDRAILETFYSTRMRRAKLIALHLDDIDHRRGLVVVRQGKGHKDRIVPIGQRALDWLNKYLSRPRRFFSLHRYS